MNTQSLGAKLFFCFSALLLLAMLQSYFLISTATKARAEMDSIVNESGKKLELAGSIVRNAKAMESATRAVLIYTYAKDQQRTVERQREFDQAAEGLRGQLEQIRPLLRSNEASEIHRSLGETTSAWLAGNSAFVSLVSQGKGDEATAWTRDQMLPWCAKIDRSGGELVALLRRQQAAEFEEAQSGAATATVLGWGLLALNVAIGAFVFFVIRSTNTELRSIAQGLNDGAQQVASAAVQVSGASQSLAQAASEQAASLEETSASGEELTAMTRKNAEHAQSASVKMSEVDRHVGEANRTLEKMVVSMKEINSSSDKISKIIKVIDEIAFQTNILALNAAVEAARAGDAGMGFAVVADEVRSLAQRCAQAAKDTAALIEESISKSTGGSASLQEVVSAIQSITGSSGEVRAIADEVNAGSQQQSRGIEQIGAAIVQMEQVTQKSAANAEESASASQELSAQADGLRQLVERLNTVVGQVSSESGSRRVARAKAVPSKAERTNAAPLKTPPAARASAHRIKPATRLQRPAHSSAPAAVDEFPLDEFKDF